MLLASHIHQFSRLQGRGIWGANVFLLEGETLTLVDTGFRGRSLHIISELARLGYSPADITSIIVTHHHADHAGSLATLKGATGAAVRRVNAGNQFRETRYVSKKSAAAASGK
jgi:glyoxylase-like metal-dependent hydrolase (beta-lactamase superfamily II)